MRHMLNFEEYIEKGIVKKQRPDISRANFLIEEADKSFLGLIQRVEKIGINEFNASSLVKDSHDIILELIRAKMLLKGFNASGFSAHQDPIIAINGDWCLGADVNKDGRVAIDDKNIVSTKYGKKDCSNLNVFCDGADVNKDGKVSISDLTSVTSYYGLYGCCARASYGGRCMDSLFCPLYREPQKNLYDDFSSGVLDSNKWVARNFRSEGFIDLTEDGGVYHMAL